MRLVAEGLSLTLGAREVVSSVSLAADARRLLAVVGPNGAGKSTLLKGLAGLLPPAAGRVTLDGRDLGAWPRNDLGRHIAYLPQDRTVHWPLAVRAVVALGRLPHRAFAAHETARDHAAIEAAMAAADVTHLGARIVGELSGGERARVLMARALAQEPRLLIADEPTAGLDPGHQLALFERLTALAAKGLGVVVALHDLSAAARYCQAVVLMKEGRILAAGPPEDVLTEAPLATAYGVRIATHRLEGVPVLLPIAPLS